jgi:hypothetical protein
MPAALVARAGEMIDRDALFAAVHESLVGTKPTCSLKPQMSVVRNKTDMSGNRRNVRL